MNTDSHRDISCRYCGQSLSLVLADLGATPWANSFLEPTPEAIAREQRFPLKVMVCGRCYLAQTTETSPAEEIFTGDYAYLSSFSSSWLEHARDYAQAMIARFGLTERSQVIEVASNDGYLLQYFAAAGIPVLGVEPAANAAEIARNRSVPTRVAFFNRTTAEQLVSEGVRADLIAANNVLAHVPDIAEFTRGFATLLKPDGIATFEFPHLLKLLAELQFDTIYHEHYSYLSLLSIERIFSDCGLKIFDVEELATHGGSLRIYAQRNDSQRAETASVARLREDEAAAGLSDLATYQHFAGRIDDVVRRFREFLDQATAVGKSIAAYGAAAKGNTFLSVCGTTAAQIQFVVDRNTTKQGRLLPGSHIPILSPDALHQNRPDYVVILPWNLATEIRSEHSYISQWGGRFVIAVPSLRIF